MSQLISNSLSPSHEKKLAINLEPFQTDIFYMALDTSYASAMKFDARPGLKFLIQKVTNLQRPANLYNQATTSRLIKINSLLELTLREIDILNTDCDTVKNLLTSNQNTVDNKYRVLHKYSRLLRLTFEGLVNVYIDFITDTDGRYSQVDTFFEKKIFLMVSQPEDLAEISSKDARDFDNATSLPSTSKLSTETLDKEEFDMGENYNDREESGPEEELNLGYEREREYKPFRFPDFAGEGYSSDSGPESEPETDYSRPASRLGSVSERIYYLNKSGRTSSQRYLDFYLQKI